MAAGQSDRTQEDYGPPSLLLLGPPGAGKTTLLRDIAHLLAERYFLTLSNVLLGELTMFGSFQFAFCNLDISSTGFVCRIQSSKVTMAMGRLYQMHSDDVGVADNTDLRSGWWW